MTMGAIIHKIPLGLGNVYLIKESGMVLIDSGSPKKCRRFEKCIEEIAVNPKDIQLIILTHGHWDHIGSAADIKELTGACLAIHEQEINCLENATQLKPRGVNLWGKVMVRVSGLIPDKFMRFKTAKADIVFSDKPYALSEFGISGHVIHTPGHTSGSISVVLDSGEAFVGDLAMNKFPLSLSPGLPIFADSISTVVNSWKKLLALGISTIFPAHGEPFSADVIRKKISQREK